MKRFVAMIIAAAAVLLLSGCGGDKGGGGDESNTTSSTVVPTLVASTGTVAENSATGTSVGTVTVSDTGDSAITAITLSGTGNENFSVSTAGAITVASGASLDYESTTSYALKAKATNSAGNGSEVDVTITVTNVADVVPTLTTSRGVVAESAVTGDPAGSITIIDAGDSAISAITLSGVDCTKFSVDTSGAITVAAGATFDRTTKNTYALKAKATNGAGDSAEVDVTITVIGDSDGDGISDQNERADGTDPNDASSLFRPFKILVEANDDLEFTVPVASDYSYSYRIDCDDDGVYEDIDTDEVNKTDAYTCTFDSEGNHTITISGTFPHIYFSGATDRRNLLSVDQWGDIEWQSFKSAFSECSNMIIRATDTPDLSRVNDMSEMFYGASTMNQDIEDWNVSNVTDMNRMFHKATAFNQSIGRWNVSKVEDMGNMFKNAVSFDQNISGWDVGSVTNMYGMFYYAREFNQDIGDWNVSSVTNMEFMFHRASKFNQDIGGWNVSSVTNMRKMFYITTHFNQNIGDWNVSNVTDMSIMFCNAADFNQDISGWDVSNVTDMKSMLKGATSFDQNLSEWDVTGNPAHTNFADGSPIEGTTKEPNWP